MTIYSIFKKSLLVSQFQHDVWAAFKTLKLFILLGSALEDHQPAIYFYRMLKILLAFARIWNIELEYFMANPLSYILMNVKYASYNLKKRFKRFFFMLLGHFSGILRKDEC